MVKTRRAARRVKRARSKDQPAPVAPAPNTAGRPAYVEPPPGVDPYTLPFEQFREWARRRVGHDVYRVESNAGGLTEHERAIDDDLRRRKLSPLPRMSTDVGLSPLEASQRYREVKEERREAKRAAATGMTIEERNAKRDARLRDATARRRVIDPMSTVTLIKDPTRKAFNAMRKLEKGVVAALRKAPKHALTVAVLIREVQKELKLPTRRKAVYRRCRKRLLAAGIVKEG